MKPHNKLLIALVLGITGGLLLHGTSIPGIQELTENILSPIGQIFLRIIFMVVVPLVLSALILGVYELSEGRDMGRVAGKTLFFTVLLSGFSVIIGVVLVNLVRPGDGFSLQSVTISQEAVSAIEKNSSQAKGFLQSLVEIIPKNPFETANKALDGEMLSLMFFALVFGMALTLGKTKREENPVVKSLEIIFEACMKIISWAMNIAPFAVFSITFNTAFKNGPSVFASVFLYAGLVVLGLLIQQFVVYSAVLKIFAHRSPWEFFKACQEVYLYAFSTASSNATLPKSIHTAETSLKIPPRIARFVLTVGSTANQNGTALFEGITVLFLAQVYGVHLDLAQQVQVVLMSILAGIGTAGVPGGSLPLIMILLQTMGIPAEGMGLILGVDRFLDMCRTTLNVSGDLVIAALVAGPPKKLRA